MRPYTVLATYKPKIWSAKQVGRDLVAITKKHGLVPFPHKDSRYEKAPWSNSNLHAHVRRRTLRKPDGSQWHQDGDFGHIPMDHSIVMWASNTPTEFRVGTTVYQPKPYEVVLFRNLKCYHRRPPEAPRIRWVFRQRVK